MIFRSVKWSHLHKEGAFSTQKRKHLIWFTTKANGLAMTIKKALGLRCLLLFVFKFSLRKFEVVYQIVSNVIK